MSAPLIWVVFPLTAAGLLFIFRGWRKSTLLAGVIISLLLALLAWLLPFGQPLNLGAWPVIPPQSISESMFLLGRKIDLSNEFRSILIFIYLFVALWIGGGYAAGADRLLVPIGLATAALLTATLAVRPFLYAALLIEMVILLNVPLLSPPGKQFGSGVLRFVAFQTLGMPFILFAGWISGSISPGLIDQPETIQAGWMAGLGLIFFASIFPFHTWIPMIAEESHPYSAGFILLTLPTVISLFILVYLVELFVPIAQPGTWLFMRFLGLLMTIIGGLWCAFQNHMGRMMGFAVVLEIGLFVVSISLSLAGSLQETIQVILAQMLPRGISLAVLALALSILWKHHRSLKLDEISTTLHKTPIAVTSLILALFTLGGTPLLAGFPARLMLWTSLGEQSFPAFLLTLGASLGVIAAGVRVLGKLFSGKGNQEWELGENRLQRLLLIVGCVFLFLVGIFPQIFLAPVVRLTGIFTY